MEDHSFRCPAVMVTAAVVGGATLLALAYYYWSRPKKSSCCRVDVATQTEPTGDPDGMMPIDGHVGAGADGPKVINFDDWPVKKARARLFHEQMEIGEKMMEEEETLEVGAMHMANVCVLTGSTEVMLEMLRGSIPHAHYVCIQKWLPSADERVNQLLQEKLSCETIEHNFG